MRRKLILLLALVLLFSGCGTQQNPDISGEQTQDPTVSLYIPQSKVEQLTGGAIRCYDLQLRCDRIMMLGDKLLLIAENGTLTVLGGDDGQVLASRSDIAGSCWDTAVTGAACYLQSTNEILLLNPQLQEHTRRKLPDGIQGAPVIDLKGQQVYFCQGQEIRAMDLQTGISRLVKSHTVISQELLDCYFDNQLLACRVEDHLGSAVLYISTQTGQTMVRDDALYRLETYVDRYFALRMDGKIKQRIYGALAGGIGSLLVDAADENLLSALSMNGMVGLEKKDYGLDGAFYDLQTGKCTATVLLPGVSSVSDSCSDRKCIWLLGENGRDMQTLYRWEVSLSQGEADGSYTGKLFTAQNPDADGIAKLQSRVDTLNQKYGVQIRLWQDGVEKTGQHTLIAEHQTANMEAFLNALEPVLALFPEGFLNTTLKAGDICISLVRSIDGGQTACAQYWAGGDCWIVMTPDADVAQSALWGIGCAVDSHVLGNSRDFDHWSQLNPKKFTYDYDYAANAQRQDYQKYLEGEDRAFVDLISMSFPHEDRARLFAAAMTDGNEEVFTSSIMQAKLKQMKNGIREAYDWEKLKDVVFPWEQYLK